jgi:hypothetical protein
VGIWCAGAMCVGLCGRPMCRPRMGAWCWLSVGLVGMGLVMWYSFRCCACVLAVWFVFAVLCVLRSSVVILVVRVVNELHREVRGLKAILACDGLLCKGVSIGAREVQRQGE